VRACERGLGAALVPVPLADLWFKHGSIVRLFSEQLVTEVSYYLVVGRTGPTTCGLAAEGLDTTEFPRTR